ncbi:MAG TPA: hypothetical protein VKU36_05360 [Candidatus Babeliales bacterium]|nr:hypothetical protein [Candidatus Babeliales bacterium]
MKKLVGMIAGLLIIVPSIAMELVITEKENTNFVQHLSRAVGFSNKMVEEKKVPENNPIHLSLTKLSNILSVYDNDLLKAITLDDPNLYSHIYDYKEVDSSPLIKLGLTQVKQKVGDVDEARKFVIRTRQLSAGLELQKQEPKYSNQWIGEVQTQDRIDFMLRNAEYPVYWTSMRKYIALLIYQMVFAYQLD